ncbi:hypothetical protein AMK68_00505 [candidate division KD3-62 bacterium DG_56]|uniref:Type II secretion system protein GspC N-terminal domain-containing protein n=1 Tax=candidate division KD3-62 bacterium DG_56 TaxID=1704032 RepID=A0A0S7XQM0_9BACT|nr:MAG: hypothetical protein AMK68_00505 [candidate division KD3-62 bacterium DG_56]
MDKRHKELILFVVALLVLGAMVVMTLGKVKGKPAARRPEGAKTAVAVAQRPTGPPGDAAGKTVSEGQADEGPLLPYQGNIAVQPRRRDPFIPTVAVGRAAKGNSSSQTPPTVVPQVRTKRPDPFPFSLATLGGPFGGQVRPVEPNGGPSAVSAQPTVEPLVLTGIVANCRSLVAIFRRADKRFFVKPGEQFAGYRVVDISTHRVVLVRGGKHHTVFLGGKL